MSADHPGQPQGADVFIHFYPQLRRELRAASQAHTGSGDETPDHYRILGVTPSASYTEIERAYRFAVSESKREDPKIAQAWRVLGDPLNRAGYDRSQRESVLPVDSDPLTDPRILVPPSLRTGRGRFHLPGRQTRELMLDQQRPSTAQLTLVVEGESSWSGRVWCDQRGVTVEPHDLSQLQPGVHVLTVTVDPRQIPRQSRELKVSLADELGAQTVHFDLHRGLSPVSRRREAIAMSVCAILLIGLGWTLGIRYIDVTSSDPPASTGTLQQIPAIQDCFSLHATPRPAWIDVHTDGLGRPTGFSLGGTASPDAEACIRSTLTSLTFPTTADGRPVFHRYQIPPLQDQP